MIPHDDKQNSLPWLLCYFDLTNYVIDSYQQFGSCLQQTDLAVLGC